MSPTGTLFGFYHSKMIAKIDAWSELNGGYAFDSSTGFALPDGSVRSTDAAWRSHKKWGTLTDEQKEKFAPICPELVVEIASASDSIHELKNKMIEWVVNGIELGWLIDVKNERVYVYTNNGVIETITSFDEQLDGREVLQGFVFDLGIFREK